jgi:hypothetical protein
LKIFYAVWIKWVPFGANFGGLLFGAAFFVIPGIGPVAIGGPKDSVVKIENIFFFAFL